MGARGTSDGPGATAVRPSTHASSSSRVDIRRLQVLQLPLREQEAYAAVFQSFRDFEAQLGKVADLGRGLVSDVSDLLAAGGLGA